MLVSLLQKPARLVKIGLADDQHMLCYGHIYTGLYWLTSANQSGHKPALTSTIFMQIGAGFIQQGFQHKFQVQQAFNLKKCFGYIFENYTSYISS